MKNVMLLIVSTGLIGTFNVYADDTNESTTLAASSTAEPVASSAAEPVASGLNYLIQADTVIQHLFRAIEHNRDDRVAQYAAEVQENELIKAVDANGLTALHQVVAYARNENNALAMAKVLMPRMRQSLWTKLDLEGDTPLHLAAARNYPLLIKYFVTEAWKHVRQEADTSNESENKVDEETIKSHIRYWLDTRNSKGLTAVQQAFLNNGEEATELLMSTYKSKLNFESWPESVKRQSLKSGVEWSSSQKMQLVENLLARNPTNLDIMDFPYYNLKWSQDYEVAMAQAVRRGHHAVLKSFIDLLQIAKENKDLEGAEHHLQETWIGFLAITMDFSWRFNVEKSKKIAQLIVPQVEDINAGLDELRLAIMRSSMNIDAAEWRRPFTSLLDKAIDSDRSFFVQLLIEAGAVVRAQDVKKARRRFNSIRGSKETPLVRERMNTLDLLQAAFPKPRSKFKQCVDLLFKTPK